MDDRKTYYSFHDVPFKDSYNTSINPINQGFRFSKNEIIQILIAIAVLTIAFSFAFAPSPPLSNLSSVIDNLPLAFLAIVTAFFCHEMAHKYMGLKYGYWSEFRIYPFGLLLALFLGLTLGVVFAAPGAVTIFGQPNKDEYGKISAAGPTTNLIIAGIFLILSNITTGGLGLLFFFIGYINTFLALFNLLPLGMLDGLKVFRWRVEIWVALFLTGIFLFVSFLNI